MATFDTSFGKCDGEYLKLVAWKSDFDSLLEVVLGWVRHIDVKTPFLTPASGERGNNKVVFVDFPIFWDSEEAKGVKTIPPRTLKLQNNFIVVVQDSLGLLKAERQFRWGKGDETEKKEQELGHQIFDINYSTGFRKIKCELFQNTFKIRK